MARRSIAYLVVGSLGLVAVACDSPLPSTTQNATASVAPGNVAQPVDIGGPLFPPKSFPPRPASVGLVNAPIVVRGCQVALAETQNVPSKNDGKLWFYCTEKQPGEVVDKADIIVHPRTAKEYRRLREGDTVKKGQLVAIMDDMQPEANRRIQAAALLANQAKKIAAQEIQKVSLEEKNMQLKLKVGGGGTESEYRRASAQYEKSIADVADAEGQIQKSVEDLAKAKIIVDEHEIRADIGGVVKRFYRKPGEAVKALEPVLEIQNLDKLRIEGMMDMQYLPAVMRSNNPKVNIEPAVQDAQLQTLEGHLQPVRSVAVSKNSRLVVTGSDDKTARVWDREAATPQKMAWDHKVAVKSVACTPPNGEGNFALTGAEDGLIRLWDLDKLDAKPVREMKGRHTKAINCVAFAPDGKTCASADDKEIQLWDVATGELKYRFPNQHRGQILSIQFTPQSKLVSASRDKTMCVWNLGEKGAAPETVIEHRSGDVPVLGVSADGSRVLFDLDRTLRVLTLPDQRTEGVFQSPSESAQFSTFAIFSPDGRLVLTAGSGDNPLQLWKTPAAGARGYLFRRLAVGPSSLPTCAAFAPDGNFAVTGTQDNKALVWAMPAKAAIDREWHGNIVFRDSSIDPNDRRVRIWAELLNPDGVRVPAGDTVTMVIPQ